MFVHLFYFCDMDNNEQFNTTWRKVASAIYKKPVDSKIFGSVEVDVTNLEKFVSEKRKEGVKITLTHIFVLIISRAFQSEVPQFNTYLRRGKIVARPSIDANVTVLQADGSMTSVKIDNSNTLTLKELELKLNEEIVKSRKGSENETMQNKNFVAKLPWPFRNWFFYIYRTLIINWGLSFPILKLGPNSFGSFVITNIGSLGLDSGFPALLPTSNVSLVFVMGGIQKKPVVVNDEIVIRRMMTLNVVFDHRIADASHGATLFKFIKQMIKNPEELERK